MNKGRLGIMFLTAKLMKYWNQSIRDKTPNIIFFKRSLTISEKGVL